MHDTIMSERRFTPTLCALYANLISQHAYQGRPVYVFADKEGLLEFTTKVKPHICRSIVDDIVVMTYPESELKAVNIMRGTTGAFIVFFDAMGRYKQLMLQTASAVKDVDTLTVHLPEYAITAM